MQAEFRSYFKAILATTARRKSQSLVSNEDQVCLDEVEPFCYPATQRRVSFILVWFCFLKFINNTWEKTKKIITIKEG